VITTSLQNVFCKKCVLYRDLGQTNKPKRKCVLYRENVSSIRETKKRNQKRVLYRDLGQTYKPTVRVHTQHTLNTAHTHTHSLSHKYIQREREADNTQTTQNTRKPTVRAHTQNTHTNNTHDLCREIPRDPARRPPPE
jgi:hypothetical protein